MSWFAAHRVTCKFLIWRLQQCLGSAVLFACFPVPSSLFLFSHSVMSNSLPPGGPQHARLPCPSLSPGVCSNSCPLSRWCHSTTSSSVTHFSYCLQSFPASGSFPVSQLFASGGQNIWDSTSASVLPMNIQGWFPLRLTGLISLQSKGLSTVFSNTTIRKYQFFGIQPFLSSSFHIRTWLLEKPSSSFPLNMTLEGLSRLPLFRF